MRSAMKKSMFGLLLTIVVIACAGCKSDEEKLLGKWYQVNEEKKTYDPSKYFEFYDDGMFRTVVRENAETGSYDVKEDKLVLQNDEIGRIEFDYTLTYEENQPKKLKLKVNNREVTLLNAETVE